MSVSGNLLASLTRRVAVITVCLLASGCLNVFVANPERVVLYEENPSQRSERAREGRAQRAPLQAVSTARFHIVRSGDTVYQISRRYDTPIRSIIDRNALRPPYVLKNGRRLTLPPPRFHTVRDGDTIYSISRHYNLAMNRVVRANKIVAPYQIFTGQKLKLYGARASRPVSSVRMSTRTNSVSARPTVTPRKTAPQRRVKSNREAKRFSATRRPAPRSGKSFLLPVRGKVISAFGPKQKGLHNDGVNIAAPRGAAVRAAENGIVVYSGNELLGYGNMILVRHADGLMTAYGHNQTILVRKGQRIRRGEVIAKVGSTGNVSTPQLHFEIRKGKHAVDPAKFIKNLS